jgi:hypothetical protein
MQVDYMSSKNTWGSRRGGQFASILVVTDSIKMDIFASIVLLLLYLLMIFIFTVKRGCEWTVEVYQVRTCDNAFYGRRQYILSTTHHLHHVGHQEVVHTVNHYAKCD